MLFNFVEIINRNYKYVWFFQEDNEENMTCHALWPTTTEVDDTLTILNLPTTIIIYHKF